MIQRQLVQFRNMAGYSYEEIIESCQKNAEIASGHVRTFRQRLAQCSGPGEERDAVLNSLSRYEAEYKHWSDYVGYYRGRAGAEGMRAVPALALVPEPPAREVGADDDEDDAHKPG